MTTSRLAAKWPGPLAGVVNGPEDAPLDWSSINWRQVEDDVQRLRQRTFTAAKEQDLCRVRSLQKLMLGSRSNALWNVRRVTEVNAGRKTAGVDGLIGATVGVRWRWRCCSVERALVRLFGVR